MSRLVTKKKGFLGLGSTAIVATLAGALAVSTVSKDEGLRLKTYKDIVGVPTYCYGETKGAKMGQVYTKAQCDALLLARLDEFATKVEACVKKPMSDKTLVSFVSFSYNVGSGGFCGSSTVRLYNAGDYKGACNAMLAWNKGRIGGVLQPIRGLTLRRERERAMCLAGL